MEKIIIGPTDALGLIDPNNDFGHPRGALYVQGFPFEVSNDEVKENIRTLIAKPLGFKVVSFDMHPTSGHIEFELYGPHVVVSTWGARCIDEFAPLLSQFDFELIKGMDPAVISLSIMTSPMFGELIRRLRERGIKRIFLCGWAYTHCVGLSAIALAMQGFEVYVVRDATRSVSAEFGGDPERMAKQLAFDGVKEITMADLA